WRSDFIRGLLWFRPAAWWMSTYLPQIPRPDVRPVAPYIAPSWSWASIDGPIFYPHDFNLNTFEGEGAPTVIEIRTIMKGQDPRGQLSSGFVKLAGCVVSIDQEWRGRFISNSAPATDNVGSCSAAT